MDNKLYIGENEIESVFDDKDNKDTKVVNFIDGKSVKLKSSLYNLIVKTAKGNGTVTDSINAYIAKDVVIKMAEYGLERVDVEGVAQAIGTLIHNLTELKIGEKFGCDNSSRIKIADIIK